MKSWIDNASRIASRAIELLLLDHPTRTSLGVILGGGLHGIFELLNPLISRVSWLAPERVTPFHFLAVRASQGQTWGFAGSDLGASQGRGLRGARPGFYAFCSIYILY